MSVKYVVLLPAEQMIYQEAYGPYLSRDRAEAEAAKWNSDNPHESAPAFVIEIQPAGELNQLVGPAKE